ncbi:MAG: alpha-glucan family phosphorylase, partial [Desulfovibrio sp.]|nr:alpha-glucan family phosphorylase [Desulfovibrio sp.]
DLANSSTHVLALCCVMGGYTGVNGDAVSGDAARMPSDGGQWLCSHHVHNPAGDEILAACRRLGLDNMPGSHVSVIFNPALLNGRDGFLNLPYEEVLAASDLGVFPSWYEPWGYTPEESTAYAVPTVTSDLAGFGLWVRGLHVEDCKATGVTILQRRQKRFDDVVVDLEHAILAVCGLGAEEMTALRKAARHTASLCDWTEFFPFYIKAYNLALSKALEHGAELREAVSDHATHIFMDQSSLTPLLHAFTALTKLPKSVSRLRELGSNLWWCWHPECWPLFQRINPEVWESSNHNPLQCLEEASDQAFSELVSDSASLALYEDTIAKFDEYMARPLNEEESVTARHPVAYFSTEYGLHESLPIYSGGLGVLSGDHLKSASDMNIPLIAIGLFYRYGYFRQQIDKNGRQVAVYPENDVAALPLEAVRGDGGEQLEISIQLPERRLFARVWLVKVGTIPLYLLDTNLEKNTPDDRKITDTLYVADRDFRVRQEILLGMGGVELLDALGIRPSVFHMNEGHSAFLILERIRRFVCKLGLSFKEAGEIVRSSCVFTTHTPVEAGNERFRRELMAKYFAGYANNVGITMNEFLDLGRMEGGSADNFEMTVLALRYSARANGVSRLHGDVSRHMWQKLWRGMPIAEVPIGHVTNGVHMPSYAGFEMAELLVRNLGRNWMDLSAKAPGWYKFASVPDKTLWRIRLF